MPNKKKTVVFRTNLVNVGIGQGQMVMPPYLYSTAEFDRQGRTVSQSNYSQDGVLQEKLIREYDQAGQVVKEFYFTEEGAPSEVITFNRDEQGRMLSEIKTYLDGSQDTTTYHYDQEGRVTEKVTVDDEGDTDQTEKFTWKEKLLIRHEVKDQEGQVTGLDEFSYNERGLVSEHRRVSEETSEHFKMVTRYDKEGRKSSEALYDEDGDLQTMTRFEYNEQGILISTSLESASKKNTTTYTYDERGNLLGQEEVNEEGHQVVWVEHSYDEGGNLTGTVVFINGRNISQSQHYELRYEYEWFNEA